MRRDKPLNVRFTSVLHEYEEGRGVIMTVDDTYDASGRGVHDRASGDDIYSFGWMYEMEAQMQDMFTVDEYTFDYE